MRYHRRKRRNSHQEVELNLAAMLDMAFQLLTFFILTFRPAPVEGQVQLRLPPPKPVTVLKNAQEAGSSADNTNPLQGVNSLVITVLGRKDGSIEGISLGESTVPNLGVLETRVHSLLANEGTGFDQVVVQVGSDLHYDQLMRVIDICTRAKLPNGERLSKLSFVELPSGP